MLPSSQGTAAYSRAQAWCLLRVRATRNDLTLQLRELYAQDLTALPSIPVLVRTVSSSGKLQLFTSLYITLQVKTCRLISWEQQESCLPTKWLFSPTLNSLHSNEKELFLHNLYPSFESSHTWHSYLKDQTQGRFCQSFGDTQENKEFLRDTRKVVSESEVHALTTCTVLALQQLDNLVNSSALTTDPEHHCPALCSGNSLSSYTKLRCFELYLRVGTSHSWSWNSVSYPYHLVRARTKAYRASEFRERRERREAVLHVTHLLRSITKNVILHQFRDKQTQTLQESRHRKNSQTWPNLGLWDDGWLHLRKKKISDS